MFALIHCYLSFLIRLSDQFRFHKRKDNHELITTLNYVVWYKSIKKGFLAPFDGELLFSSILPGNVILRHFGRKELLRLRPICLLENFLPTSSSNSSFTQSWLSQQRKVPEVNGTEYPSLSIPFYSVTCSQTLQTA